ncbi:CvpA family protein [Parapedomonas caeni]
MTAFDIFVLAIVGLSGLYGISRGLVVELLSLGAWIAAILALKLLFTPISHWMRDSIGSDAGGDIAALVLIVLVTVALVRLAATLLGNRVKSSALAPLDRLGGGAFGMARGLIIVSFAYMFLGLFLDHDEMPDWIAGAKTYGVVSTSANLVSDFIGWVREEHGEEGDGEMVNGMLLPPDHPPAGDGYSDRERRELDKLFEKSSDKEVDI